MVEEARRGLESLNGVGEGGSRVGISPPGGQSEPDGKTAAQRGAEFQYDFDGWQWWRGLERGGPGSPRARLAAPGAFSWGPAGREAIAEELMREGVARLGTVSEAWMVALEDLCATVPYDTVLSLGCSRREDSYKAHTGAPLAAPWAEWMGGLEHEFGYASVITAFPAGEDEGDQGWHRDTPDDFECRDHQVTLMVYITDVRVPNGATQFRRMVSGDEVTLPGPRGSVVGFVSSRVEHRGLANREGAPRLLMYISFDHEGEGDFVEVNRPREEVDLSI